MVNIFSFLKEEDQEKDLSLGIKITLVLNLFVANYIVREPIDVYYSYLTYLFYFPAFLRKFSIPRSLMLIFGMILVTGVIQSIAGNNTLSELMKVFVGTFAAYLFFYFIVMKLDYSPQTLFKFYCKAAFYLSSFGIFQTISHVLGDPLGKALPTVFGLTTIYTGGPLDIRVSTFFGEPSYYAMFMSGAVFVAIHDLVFQSNKFVFNRLFSVIVIIGVYLSFSGTLLLTLGLSLFFVGLNYGLLKYSIILIPLALLLFQQILSSSDEFGDRYQGTLEIFLDAPQENLDVFAYHGSSVILYNNFHVALENFKQNPLFGTGIGSHPVAYEKYSLTKNVTTFGFDLNKKDANSMFNRLLSEAGLFGLGFFAFFIVRFYLRKSKDNQDHLWVISSACLIVIIVNLGRQGHYFLHGFPFYVWMYYYVWTFKKSDQSNIQNQST
jgi:hypothetical protein